ncbi:hypothetical protein [Nocardia africana]
MSVFSEERLSTMRAALREGLARARMVQNARFTALLRAGDENLVITTNGELSAVDVVDTPLGTVDFGLEGSVHAWEGYFSSDGKVQRSSVIGMATVGDVSGGVVASELAVSGDLVRLIANLPVLNLILESAAQPYGA